MKLFFQKLLLYMKSIFFLYYTIILEYSNRNVEGNICFQNTLTNLRKITKIKTEGVLFTILTVS